MAYTLYGPNNIKVSTDTLDDLPMLLGMPRLAKYVPQNLVADSAVNTNRSSDVDSDTPVFTRIYLNITPDNTDDKEAIGDVVTKWATRCRIPGIRGQRLAIVKDLEHYFDEEDDLFKIMVEVLIGSVVFYNERRATACVSLTNEEMIQDLENLHPFIHKMEATINTVHDSDQNEIYPNEGHVLAVEDLSTQAANLQEIVLNLIKLGAVASNILVSGSRCEDDDIDQLPDAVTKLLQFEFLRTEVERINSLFST